MGGLTLPTSGLVYMDANCIIYSVEHVAPYDALLAPIWKAASPQTFQIVTSELAVLEVLVRPFKTQDTMLEASFRDLLLHSTDVLLIPVTLLILERAAKLRATTGGVKTPDAIHAATALEVGATQFLTNDAGLRSVANLSVTLLDELLTP